MELRVAVVISLVAGAASCVQAAPSRDHVAEDIEVARFVGIAGAVADDCRALVAAFQARTWVLRKRSGLPEGRSLSDLAATDSGFAAELKLRDALYKAIESQPDIAEVDVDVGGTVVVIELNEPSEPVRRQWREEGNVAVPSGSGLQWKTGDLFRGSVLKETLVERGATTWVEVPVVRDGQVVCSLSFKLRGDTSDDASRRAPGK